ncbi:Choline transport protein [Sphaceloma murrayae]|uniref:Choline transport protein n=1 Tax=Sphaceloma murrayae TaxID=2082308 RepID=A0A2K1QS87_9PEZI|nr:Choline transport protein [Sphaceloma murrayae]
MASLSMDKIKIKYDSTEIAMTRPYGSVDIIEPEKMGVEGDRRDMHRMGKKQEMRRTFDFFSIWGYAVILGNTWEFSLVTGVLSLAQGGPAGAIWMFLTTCFGMFFVMLSMAEMASIAPTAGGQYHWVSEFAPPQYQKLLSYIVGWLCVLGWQTCMVIVGLVAASQFTALIALSNPTYTIKGWHTALLIIAITSFAILINTFLVRKLPLLEGIVMFFHIFGFFAVFVILWIMGPRAPASEVFTEFEDNAGWGNIGLACLVGISSPVVTLVGADSSCHLSEELQNASWVLPRAMIATAATNYALGFLMTVTLMMNLGDVSAALASPTGQPYVYVLQQATRSYTATWVLTSIVAILLVSCAINQVTTSSRQLFAFARDGGLPFSSFLGHVHPGYNIPLNAVLVTLGFTCVLSFVVIGSSTALSNITTLSLTGLISSYAVAIGCIFAKRIRGEEFPSSRFKLPRKLGFVTNAIALCWLSLTFVMMFFPGTPIPDAKGMNWSALIFSAVVGFSLLYYRFSARGRYVGPVEYVRKDL